MAITLVQSTIGTVRAVSAPANPYTGFSTSVTVAAGDFIVLFVGWFHAATSLSTVTGGGLTWTIDKQGQAANPAADGFAIVTAQAPAGLASGTTLTLTWSATPDACSVSGSEFAGVATSSPVDATVGPVGVSPATNAWSTGNVTITAGSLLVGGVFNESADNRQTSTAGAELADFGSASGFSAAAGYRIEAAGGSYAISGTWDSAATAQSTTVGAAYLAAAGGSTDTGGGVSVTRPGRHRGRFPGRSPDWF